MQGVELKKPERVFEMNIKHILSDELHLFGVLWKM